MLSLRSSKDRLETTRTRHFSRFHNSIPHSQDYGNKRTTLYDIRDELCGPYTEHRSPFARLSSEDKFTLLTGETPEGLEGKLVVCTVVGIVRRKQTREVLDRANPIKDDRTGFWQCPFCLKSDFGNLSLVSTRGRVWLGLHRLCGT